MPSNYTGDSKKNEILKDLGQLYEDYIVNQH